MNNKKMEELALRKQLLQARSALCRLKIHQEVHAVRDNLQWANIGARVVTSLPIRSTLLAFILKYLRGAKATRLLAFTGRIILFAKLASIVFRLMRKS